MVVCGKSFSLFRSILTKNQSISLSVWTFSNCLRISLGTTISGIHSHTEPFVQFTTQFTKQNVSMRKILPAFNGKTIANLRFNVWFSLMIANSFKAITKKARVFCHRVYCKYQFASKNSEGLFTEKIWLTHQKVLTRNHHSKG